MWLLTTRRAKRAPCISSGAENSEYRGNMRASDIKTDLGTAVQQETPTLRAERGIVYAFHFLPYHFDPRLEQFWASFSEKLARQGHTLIILSTTELVDKNLLYIQVPYNLPDYQGNELVSENCPSHVLTSVKNWYGCNTESAQRGWKSAQAFFLKYSAKRNQRPSSLGKASTPCHGWFATWRQH